MSEVTTSSAPVESSSSPESTSGAEGAEQTSGSQLVAQSLKERFKLKVDGEDVEEELDWNDKESIRNKLQLAHAAKKRMGEAADAKKKAYDIVKQFEADPESMLKRLGPKGREIAEKYLMAQIQDEMLDPKEREYRDTKAELEKFRKDKADAEASQNKTAQEKKEYEYAQNFQTTIIEALNKSGLPKSPELVKRMASLMSKNLAMGLELTPSDLVTEVKAEITQILKSVIGDSDGDHLINLFGEDTAKKIRMSDLKKLQEKNSKVFQSGAKAPTAANRNSDRPMSIEEWKESLNERIKD